MRYVFSFLLLFCIIQKGMSQLSSNPTDLQLIESTSFSGTDTAKYYKGELNSQKMMHSPNGRTISKINPLLFVARTGMWVYQNTLSPQLSRECPYEITCSNFSKQAIERFGLLKGVLISADRLMRCNPFSLSSVDDSKININTQKIIDYPWWYK